MLDTDQGFQPPDALGPGALTVAYQINFPNDPKAGTTTSWESGARSTSPAMNAPTGPMADARISLPPLFGGAVSPLVQAGLLIVRVGGQTQERFVHCRSPRGS